MISDRFEVGDGGLGNLFADEGEILVEDVAILRDGDRVSYVPSTDGAPMKAGKRKANPAMERLGASISKVLKTEESAEEECHHPPLIRTEDQDDAGPNNMALSPFNEHVPILLDKQVRGSTCCTPESATQNAPSGSTSTQNEENLTPSSVSDGASESKSPKEGDDPHYTGEAFNISSTKSTSKAFALLEEKQFITTVAEGSPLFRHKSKCVSIPLENPTAADFPEALEESPSSMEAPIQPISGIMNFPTCEKALHPDFRCCVMCGKVCPTKRYKSRSSSPIVPPQNKGVCTACDVTIWVVIKSGLKIKWCKGCKNFQPWSTFGVKPHATKCVRCRHQQRERYARKKEKEAAIAAMASA